MRYLVALLLLMQSFSLNNLSAFSEKMSYYYGYELRYEVKDIGSWLGGTVYSNGGCTTEVYLSKQFFGQLGNDDLWKGVLAHEWAHTLQGSECANNEYGADIIALQKLWEARELSAFFRYGKFLQEQWDWTQEDVSSALSKDDI